MKWETESKTNLEHTACPQELKPTFSKRKEIEISLFRDSLSICLKL
jgi:hypothetical protein